MQEWGLLETGAWGPLRGSRGTCRAAVDEDFEFPVVMLNMVSTVLEFKGVVEEDNI